MATGAALRAEPRVACGVRRGAAGFFVLRLAPLEPFFDF